MSVEIDYNKGDCTCRIVNKARGKNLKYRLDPFSFSDVMLMSTCWGCHEKLGVIVILVEEHLGDPIKRYSTETYIYCLSCGRKYIEEEIEQRKKGIEIYKQKIKYCKKILHRIIEVKDKVEELIKDNW